LGAIFLVFHVSHLKKCLRVPKERVEVRRIKLKSDLSYEEKLVYVLDVQERVTQNRVVKIYKVVWRNHSEHDAMWEREDYLRDNHPIFYTKWYAFQISGRDFYKGEGYNTPSVILPHLHWHYMSISIIHQCMSFIHGTLT
jgi:hypothetical protein